MSIQIGVMAPAPLAVNLLAAGWLSTSAVAVIPATGATVTLAPSSGLTSPRMAVVGLDDHSFLTVELLAAEGFDDHLPATGVAVHLIEGNDATRVADTAGRARHRSTTC